MTREFDARSNRYGRYFDEFEIGDIYNHWPGKTITESEDHLYCLSFLLFFCLLLIYFLFYCCQGRIQTKSFLGHLVEQQVL